MTTSGYDEGVSSCYAHFSDSLQSSGRRQGGGLGDDAYGSGRTGDDNFGSGRGTGGFGGDDSFGSSGRTGGGLGMFPFQDLQGLAIV